MLDLSEVNRTLLLLCRVLHIDLPDCSSHDNFQVRQYRFKRKKNSLFYQTIEAKSTLNLTRSYFKNVCLQMRSDGDVQGSQSVKIRQGHLQGR